MGRFDHLIPKVLKGAGAAERLPGAAGRFDHLIPEAPPAGAPEPNIGGLPPDASAIDYATQSAHAAGAIPRMPAKAPGLSEMIGGVGSAMLHAEQDNQMAARQRIDAGGVFEGQPQPLGLAQIDDGSRVSFKDAAGNDVMTDRNKHVVLRDPTTGQLSVYERRPEDEESMIKSLGRMILPGFVAGPVTGAQRAVGVAGRIDNATNAARAGQAAEDLAAFNRLEVPVAPGSFSSQPVRGTVKQLSETMVVGSPIRAAMERTFRGMSEAVGRTAQGISPTTEFNEAGAQLQRGLDRFRTAGVRSIEPGVLAERGIDPVAQVAPGEVMSRAAAGRLAEAAPIRAANQGGRALTSRGVDVPAARSLDQTLVTRRAIEDMDDTQVQRLIGTPASETSFAVRSEALYENARRQLPTQMRIDNTANPQRLSAVNTRNALNAMRAHEETTRIPGGVVAGGRYSGMAERFRTGQQHTNLDELRQMRTAIGQDLSSFQTYERGLNRTQLNRIYAAISRDIEVGYQDLANRAHIGTRISSNRPDHVTVATARAADRALFEFRRADRYFRGSMQRMETFLNVVDASHPEQAAQRLVRAATSAGRGNIGLFRNAMSSLRPEERASFGALVLRHMGRPQDSAQVGGLVREFDFSPATFTTNFRKMDPRARAMLYPGEHGRAIDDLITVAERIQSVEGLANTSRSGTNALNLGGLAAGLAALSSFNVVTPAAIGGGMLGASYLLSRPAWARWAATYLQLKSVAMRAPNAVTAELVTHVNRLTQMARRDPTLATIASIARAENGIEEGTKDQGGQEQGAGGIQPDQNQDAQRESSPHAGDPSQFAPPMHLGGPKSPQAELTNRTPDLKEDLSAFLGRQFGDDQAGHRLGRQVVEAFDLMSLYAFSGVADAEKDIREGAEAGALPGQPGAGQFNEGLQNAALSFLPGARRAKGLAKNLGDEISDLIKEISTLTGKPPTPRPRPIRGTPPEEVLQSDLRRRDALKAELDEVRGGIGPGAPGAVPGVEGRAIATERADVLDAIGRRRAGVAVKGKRGLLTQGQAKEAAEKFFKDGNRLPQMPWGRGDNQDAAREAISKGFASLTGEQQGNVVATSKAVVKEAGKAVEVARHELKIARGASRLLAGDLVRQKRALKAANEELVEAQRQAKFYQEQRDKAFDELERINNVPPKGGG